MRRTLCSQLGFGKQINVRSFVRQRLQAWIQTRTTSENHDHVFSCHPFAIHFIRSRLHNWEAATAKHTNPKLRIPKFGETMAEGRTTNHSFSCCAFLRRGRSTTPPPPRIASRGTAAQPRSTACPASDADLTRPDEARRRTNTSPGLCNDERWERDRAHPTTTNKRVRLR